ncbi:SBP domain containing protein [Dorcoceras hygrometricum]|uniref:SBP domain containing protein n=1 Tax=Dorcoceras hygrometricum TaxID=472368 RepID=A0A2Z6ZU99_9LAMI|nr:SBP domain containing protein [Dorcoceras hygrometricum]
MPAGRFAHAMRAHGRAGRGAAARGGGVAVVQNFDDFNMKIETLDTIWQYVLIRSENLGSDTTVGWPRRIRITPPGEAAEEQNNTGRRSIQSTTGDGIPSSACTRRPDEIGADGFSSSSWPEQIPAARDKGGGGGGL